MSVGYRLCNEENQWWLNSFFLILENKNVYHENTICFFVNLLKHIKTNNKFKKLKSWNYISFVKNTFQSEDNFVMVTTS
jgi:hypothetical protein